jgi:hypothetical protein
MTKCIQSKIDFKSQRRWSNKKQIKTDTQKWFASHEKIMRGDKNQSGEKNRHIKYIKSHIGTYFIGE